MFIPRSGGKLILNDINLFYGDSANEVWDKAYKKLIASKLTEVSRAGKTRYINQAIFQIKNPRNRLVVNRDPGLSIAFSVAEIIWILAGSNKSRVINLFNPVLHKFAGEDETYYGAYGYRLISESVNQIKLVYETLRDNPLSRQAVLSIWHPTLDLPFENGKPRNLDIPCNVLSILKVSNGKLFWTQIMRSNDLLLGTPYNFMQFTILHELYSNWLNLDIGDYVLVCHNLHIYEKAISKYQNIKKHCNEIIIDLYDYDKTMRNVMRLYQGMSKLAYLSVIDLSDLDEFCNIQLDSIFLNDCKWLLASYLYSKIGAKKHIIECIDKVQIKILKSEMNRWLFG